MKSFHLTLFLLAASSGLTNAQPTEAVKGNNDFAFRLFRQAERTKANFCFSPFSITSAFSMAYAGAAGETEKEFQKVFGFAANQNSTHKAFGLLQNDIRSRNAPGMQVALANKIFIEKTFRLDPGYLPSMQKNYGAAAEQVDFRSQFEANRKYINNWVSTQTRDRIKDLLPQGSLNPLTTMVIVNTLYLKGDWKVSFDKADTKPETFHTKPGSTMKVNMMYQRNTFNYGKSGSFEFLEMPFKGDSLSVIIALPGNDLAFDQARLQLTSEWYDDMLKKIYPQDVKVFLPKFKTETSIQLKKSLMSMGMTNAFTERVADFSKMDPSKKLYIAEAYHKVFVEVEEKGAEAAGATAIVMAISDSVAPMVTMSVFKADRPFFYIIRDRITNTILFIGEMQEPTAAN